MKTLLSILVFFSFCSAYAQNSQDTLSIYFELNSSVLTVNEAKNLNAFNSGEHGAILLVVAHCDTSGTKNYNLKLAQRRLDIVLAEIDSTANSTIAEGENISSKAKNYDAAFYRRVDIIYSNEPETPLTLVESFDAFKDKPEVKLLRFDLSILFYPGEDKMLPESFPEIVELYRIMKHNPTIHIHIHGHVCCGQNYVLSKNRANVVYRYMLEKRISGKRMKYTGHSNTLPKIWPEVTAEDKDQNRRVSVEFSKH